jgi:hypothetical protein
MLSKNIHGPFPVSTSTCLLVHLVLFVACCCLTRFGSVAQTPHLGQHIRTLLVVHIFCLHLLLQRRHTDPSRAWPMFKHKPRNRKHWMECIRPLGQRPVFVCSIVMHVCAKNVHAVSDARTSQLGSIHEVRRTPKRSNTRLYRERCECSQPQPARARHSFKHFGDGGALPFSTHTQAFSVLTQVTTSS